MTKRPIDSALDAARKRLSPQTSWIHLCYEGDGSKSDTIPLFENFCFAFALFRSRLSDDILQGKERLEKLLHFEADGAFPVYLHEFPAVRDHGLSIDLLPIFHHLHKEFAPVLGERLDARLLSLIARIVARAEAQPFAWPAGKRAKLSAAQNRFRLDPSRTVHSSAQLADELIALQMQGEISVDNLEAITRFWHAGFDLYCGPYGRELQEGGVPQPTLFDCFMGSRRTPTDHPIQLRTALVYPIPLPPVKKEGDDYLWLEDEESKALHLFWGNSGELHSLVFQGVSAWQTSGDTHLIDFVLQEEPPKEGIEKCEVNAFLNYHPSHLFHIEGVRASSFTLGQTLTLESAPLTMEMRFIVNEGEAAFYGHLLRGNRQRQVALRGEKRFAAYDWQIALRTLRRETCTVRIQLDLRRNLSLGSESLPLENRAIDSNSHGMEAVVDIECNAADC